MRSQVPRISWLCRQYGTKPKVVIQFEKDVSEAIGEKKLKARRHPGVVKSKSISLPKPIVAAITKVVQDEPLKALHEEGDCLDRYLRARHPPLEEHEAQAKLTEACQFVARKSGIDIATLKDEEREAFEKRYEGKIKKTFKQRKYSWHPIQYTDHNAKVYLISRAAAEFAVMHQIFFEMKFRIPNFTPQTLFDFGSGVGTVTWAANMFWKESLVEYFNVDSSSNMNDLAGLILKGGEGNEMPAKGVFYREFLPVSRTLKYDLVVSAFTLFELPSLEARLKTILTLWNKTQNYLVVVEQGTNAGFQLVNEAREFILDASNSSDASPSLPAAHVFSPCPHDKLCPRMLEYNTPCNFEVTYSSLNTSESNKWKKERYCYVVLKKGERPAGDLQWPRIVRAPLVRSKHTICRLCTASGKLQEIIFTSSKYGKIPYSCAKVSNWGDLLPLHIQGEDVDGGQREVEQTEDVCK